MHREQLDADRIFLIHGLLSPQECDRLIALSESTTYEPALISTDVGDVRDEQVRDNARLIRADLLLAADLWAKIESFIPAGRHGWQATGLSERFRFYRYDEGQKFARHYDGYIETPDGATSHLTFLVYLNDDFDGGETRFYPFHLDEPITVRPELGTAVVFVHRQLHEGMPVLRGRKYVLRTDVMYREVG